MNIKEAFQQLHNNYITAGNKTIKERLDRLKTLEKVFYKHRNEIKEVLYKDHKKTPEETDLIDILPVMHEFKEVKRNLYRWASPKSVTTPLLFFGTHSKISRESKGVVLIISPWNFPINLTFVPLISAIAGGNTVMVKPSEFTPNASSIITKIISEVFPPNECIVVEGGEEVGKEVLTLPFNHIFFTGSSRVGKIVMKQAAENLTSVTLELGGKSPSIIDETANISTAARRLGMIKLIVNGQICITTDHVWVHQSVAPTFVEELKKAYSDFLGDNPVESQAYSRIVNSAKLNRLLDLIEDAKQNGDEVITEVVTDDTNYLSPTIILSKSDQSKIWKQEVFGPILPIRVYTDINEPIQRIQQNKRPLALYIFSTNKKNIRQIISQTRAGATVINSTGLHHYNPKLPFGGINNSGIGKSHGEWGFNEFTNPRPIMTTHAKWSTLELLMPPYNKLKKKLIDFVIKYM